MFWIWWSGVIVRRPVTILAVAGAATAVFGARAALTPVDVSFTSLLAKDDPEVAGYRDAMRRFGASSTLLLVLEGEPEALAVATARLEAELPRRAPVRHVIGPPDAGWLLDRAPWLWPEGLFESVVEEAGRGAATPFTVNAVEAADRLIRERARPNERAALFRIELQRDPLDLAMGGLDFRRIERATLDILRESGGGVTAGFTGMTALGAQDQNAVFERIRVLTPVTLVAVLLLLMWIEKRVWRVGVAGAALASSVVIAFGMMGFIRGELTIGATFFGMVLLGLGIDFGIHLLVALRDGRSHGLDPERSLVQALHRAGNAISLGGMTTALAFGLVALMPEPAARDMALVALFGLTAALALMLSVLPAGWYVMERGSRIEAPPRLHLPGLKPLVNGSLRYPRTVLAAAALLTVIGAAGAPRYRVESDLRKIISRDVPANAVQERLEALFGITPAGYIAAAASLEQAREWAETLRAMPEIAEATSAGDLVREDAPAREAAMRGALEKAPADAPWRERLERALEAGPITVEGLPPNLSAGLVGTDGSAAVRIVPKHYTLDALEIGEQLALIRGVAPTATGMPVIGKVAIMGRHNLTPILLPLVFGVVTVVLAAAFRDWREVALALAPVTLGTAVTFGVFLWWGLQFNVMTSLIVPVILGLGVDDGIHVVERLRRHRPWTDEAIHEAVEGVGRPIFLTTATTIASFAGLLFTDHAGLESIAWFMIVGMTACFLASVSVIPALAKALRPAD